MFRLLLICLRLVLTNSNKHNEIKRSSWLEVRRFWGAVTTFRSSEDPENMHIEVSRLGEVKRWRSLAKSTRSSILSILMVLKTLQHYLNLTPQTTFNARRNSQSFLRIIYVIARGSLQARGPKLCRIYKLLSCSVQNALHLDHALRSPGSKPKTGALSRMQIGKRVIPNNSNDFIGIPKVFLGISKFTNS